MHPGRRQRKTPPWMASGDTRSEIAFRSCSASSKTRRVRQPAATDARGLCSHPSPCRHNYVPVVQPGAVLRLELAAHATRGWRAMSLSSCHLTGNGCIGCDRAGSMQRDKFRKCFGDGKVACHVETFCLQHLTGQISFYV